MYSRARWPLGAAALLLPVAQRAEAEPEARGERGLRKPEPLANRLHVHRLGDVDNGGAAPALVAAGIGERVPGAAKDAVGYFGHRGASFNRC